MSLLFDENLSPTLCALLKDLWPTATHVHLNALGSATDDHVWSFAKEKGLTIVSKDVDFRDRIIVEGFPPKLIWVRLGNVATITVAEKLRGAAREVNAFIQDAATGILELW